jgi:hypothetical protein
VIKQCIGDIVYNTGPVETKKNKKTIAASTFFELNKPIYFCGVQTMTWPLFAEN